MKRMSSVLCLFLCWLISYGRAEQTGTIRGAVVDEDGRPVVAAQVIVDPMDERPRSNAVRVVETDSVGRFSMAGLALVNYKLFAKKASAGYPDTSFAFYSNHIFATVTLTANSPVAELILKVGPAAGVVRGLVTNAKNEPISANFVLRRVSVPDNWISMSQQSEYRILLPPKTDVALEVSAPGYKTWYYGGTSDPLKRAPVRLEPRQEMSLDIQLEPEDKLEKQP